MTAFVGVVSTVVSYLCLSDHRRMTTAAVHWLPSNPTITKTTGAIRSEWIYRSCRVHHVYNNTWIGQRVPSPVFQLYTWCFSREPPPPPPPWPGPYSDRVYLMCSINQTDWLDTSEYALQYRVYTLYTFVSLTTVGHGFGEIFLVVTDVETIVRAQYAILQ